MLEILEVFTRAYREETRRMEFMKDQRTRVRLACGGESVDDKVERLSKDGYESHCHIKVPSFDSIS